MDDTFDNSSGLTDPTNVYNPRLSYGLSKFDVTNYVVASFNWNLPFARWVGDNKIAKQIVGGWSISGITKMASGVPITMSDSSDYSLVGGSGIDMPFYTAGNLAAGGVNGDHNPRDRNPATGKPYPYFNTALFKTEKVGGGGAIGVTWKFPPQVLSRTWHRSYGPGPSAELSIFTSPTLFSCG